jgi:hypothetical protein
VERRVDCKNTDKNEILQTVISGKILISAPSKILSRVILNRVKDVVVVHLNEQVSFQKQ